MEVKELKRLLDAMRDSETNELVLETGDYKLTVKRSSEVQFVQAPQPQPPALAAPQPGASQAGASQADGSQPASPPGTLEAARAAAAPAPVPSHLVQVTAPIVGTFYASPSPDAAPYVKVGDRVDAGKVLCIIEAMKLMNEIEAEVAGVIAEVLVKNEEPVEYGQVLFRIDPS